MSLWLALVLARNRGGWGKREIRVCRVVGPRRGRWGCWQQGGGDAVVGMLLGGLWPLLGRSWRKTTNRYGFVSTAVFGMKRSKAKKTLLRGKASG